MSDDIREEWLRLSHAMRVAGLGCDNSSHSSSRRLKDGRCFACYQVAWVARKRWVDKTAGASDVKAIDAEERKERSRERARQVARNWRREHVEHARAVDRARQHSPSRLASLHKKNCAKYGLTVEQYDALFESQGSACAVCGSRSPGAIKNGRQVAWHIDHDHGTGRVRGILCHQCNTGIGLLGDSEQALERAASYIRAANQNVERNYVRSGQ